MLHELNKSSMERGGNEEFFNIYRISKNSRRHEAYIMSIIFKTEFTQKKAVRILDFIHYITCQFNGTLK